jgi:hypothetical protein
MRIAIAALLASALAAAPATALQRIGARTAPPQQLLGGIAAASPEAEIAQAAAAAAAHPLGTRQNPVRVGGPDGARAYIARLRCADGSEPRAGSRSTGDVGAYGSLVDLYSVECGSARTDLAMDIYHAEHNEDRAPPGFRILPR